MKTAIITGGSRGLGQNTALKLGEKGVDVILTYRSGAEEAAEVVAALQAMGRKAAALKLDVGKSSTFPAFVQAVREVLTGWGRERFDYLVNNAGIGLNKPLLETTESDFDELMAIHLKGPFFLSNALYPLLADGGQVVNISSGLARFAVPGLGTYGTMKGALETLTRYQAKEWGARGITCNVIAPGPVETDFGGGVTRDNKEVNARYASMAALGRVGLPDDVGGAVTALLTGENRWVTAQRIEVSGGFYI